MKFYDDEAVKCDACGNYITAGETYAYIKLDGIVYRCCNYEDCCSRILFNFYQDDFLEVKLNTAEDKGCIFGDMQED